MSQETTEQGPIHNDHYYRQLCQPPQAVLKTIGGGRLKGMTDIKPQWRYRRMTEVFGPVGFGWKFEVKDFWQDVTAEGEVMVFVKVLVFYRLPEREGWSDPVEGVGGSFLITKEAIKAQDGAGGWKKVGETLHASDEAYKMAVTDALSVALRFLGVAGDIYEGRWDRKSFRADDVPAEPRQQAPAPHQASPPIEREPEEDPVVRASRHEQALSRTKVVYEALAKAIDLRDLNAMIKAHKDECAAISELDGKIGIDLGNWIVAQRTRLKSGRTSEVAATIEVGRQLETGGVQ